MWSSEITEWHWCKLRVIFSFIRIMREWEPKQQLMMTCKDEMWYHAKTNKVRCPLPTVCARSMSLSCFTLSHIVLPKLTTQVDSDGNNTPTGCGSFPGKFRARSVSFFATIIHFGTYCPWPGARFPAKHEWQEWQLATPELETWIGRPSPGYRLLVQWLLLPTNWFSGSRVIVTNLSSPQIRRNKYAWFWLKGQ